MSGEEIVTAAGEVTFYWDSGDDERHLLVNIEPDDHTRPHAFELTGDLRDAAIGELAEGARIELDFVVEHHEIVDPEGATTHDGDRPRVVAVRVFADS
jgi:hypothetical protein